jgi:transcriptional regulator with XRE-family HTH domain
MIRIDGARVRRLREDRGLLQRHLAEQASISEAYLSMIERGERKALSPATASRLALALDVSISELRRHGPRLARPDPSES